jgi:hypothetical protein
MSNVEYYLHREQAEWHLADTARDPGIRAIHQTLAEKYAELARIEARRSPSSRLSA